MMILFNNMDVNNMDVNKNLDVNSNCTNTMVSLLEGDRGRDRVQWCRLLTSFQEGLEGDRCRIRVQRCHL